MYPLHGCVRGPATFLPILCFRPGVGTMDSGLRRGYLEKIEMADLADIKAATRKAAFAARKPAHGAGLDGAACGHLSAYIAGQVAISVISGYMPIRTEISPLPVMRALVAGGKRICVPVIVRAGRALVFHEWHPDSVMVEGPYGALVPANGQVLEPELLIAPLLAFDDHGYRLGYGGGFYDRTLEGLRARRKTLAVGFAYGAQHIAEVPIESTDQPLDAVVTEAGITMFR